MKKILKENGTLIALLVLGILLSIFSDTFLTAMNLSNLTRQYFDIGIISVGMTMVILIAGIDLSVGSVVALSGVTVALLMKAGVPVFFAILITVILCGVAVGMWNGFWIAKYNIPPFIITLGMMTIARGLAHVLSKSSAVPITNDLFGKIAGNYISVRVSAVILGLTLILGILSIIMGVRQNQKYGIPVNRLNVILKIIMNAAGVGFLSWIFLSYKGIPIPVMILVVIVLVGMFTLNNTKFGRRLYAVGGNEEAARLSGINLFNTKMWVFTIVSTLAAISGILITSRLNSAPPNAGEMKELDVIAAVVIGGTSLSGGSGSIKGAIVGTFIIGFLNNGMSLMGVDTPYQNIIKGMIIILAVWFDVLQKRKKVAL